MLNASLYDGTTTVPIYAAHAAHTALVEAGRPIPPDFTKANSFTANAGRETGKGWALLKRSDLVALDLDALQTLTMTFNGVTTTFYNLVICREPLNLFPSNTSEHTDAVYLVEIADSRWRVRNPYYCMSIAKMYNVPSNADNGSGGPATYLTTSRNAGTDWTWTTLITDIWDTMSSQLGTFPGLPFTPDGAPVGWIFQGVSAWDALCDVLDRIGCIISPNLSASSNQFSIVQDGGSDTANDALIAAAIAAGRKIHDGELIEVSRAKFPAYYRVFFHKQLSTPTHIPPFLMNEVYSVDVASGVTGAESIYHPIWDDLPALVDSGGFVTNTSALSTRAAERAADYVRLIDPRTWQRFSGLLYLTPGAGIKTVTYTANAAGVYTDVFRYPNLRDDGAKDGYRDYSTGGTVQDLVRLGFPSAIDDLGIRSLNDDEDQHQTIGITDDIAIFPETIAGDNEMALIGSEIAIDLGPWVDDRQYMTGWLTGHAGKVWRALKASEGKDPTIETEYWVEVDNAARGGLHVLHIPKGRIYTPDGQFAKAGRNTSASPVEIPAGQNFKFLESGSVRITSDGETNEVTIDADSVTIVNNTNIYETNNYVENVFYFNTFNKTITILIDNEIFVFYADCCEGRQYYCMSKAAVQNCYNLLPSEYAVMLIEGYTKISGPHATKVICQTSCDGEAPKLWWCLSLTGVSGCYELTQAELLTMIDDTGDVYIPESGPHLTQAECLAECDVPDPIDTDCCPDDPTPVTLYGVLSGAGTGCECMNDVPFSMVYDAGDEFWHATETVIAACATIDGNLYLWCDAGTWNLDVDGVGHCPDPGINVVTLVDCNPLTLTCTVSVINCGCGSVGTATLTITEVAP